MAIFLIKDRDATHADPAKDRLCYKRGDVVEVFEDTKPLVLPPQPPFVIVKIAGVTKAQAEKYTGMREEPTAVVERWNRREWERCVGTGRYGEFIGVPVASADIDLTETIPVRAEWWERIGGIWSEGPFYFAPTASPEWIIVAPDGVQRWLNLTGTVHYVDVTGTAIRPHTRRLYRVLVDTIPLAIRDQLVANRYVEVTFAQIRNYVQNKKTGLTE